MRHIVVKIADNFFLGVSALFARHFCEAACVQGVGHNSQTKINRFSFGAVNSIGGKQNGLELCKEGISAGGGRCAQHHHDCLVFDTEIATN